MRIKSFSEARGIFESEEFSLEPHIYCFGGGGGGGSGSGDTSSTAASENIGTADVDAGPTTGGSDGPGGSDASGDPSEQSTVDFGGGPGFDDGDTGDTGDSSNVGGSPDDQDSMDSGYDTSTVGMGTNTMGFGGGPADDGPGFYADPFGTPTYPDVSDFGAKPTRADIAARAGVSPDTIVGSGPGGRNPVMGGGNPVKSGAAVAAEAERQGVTIGEINSRINEAATSLASVDPSIAAPETPDLIDSYLNGPMMADISTPMTGGAFVDPTTGYGIMSDIPGAAAQSAMDYTNAIATGQRGPGNMAMTTGDLSTGTGGARSAGIGFDDPLGYYNEGDIDITAVDPSFDLGFADTEVEEPEIASPRVQVTPPSVATDVDLSMLQAINQERLASGGTRQVGRTYNANDPTGLMGQGSGVARISGAENITNAVLGPQDITVGQDLVDDLFDDLMFDITEPVDAMTPGQEMTAFGSQPTTNQFQEQPEDQAIYGGRGIASPQVATLTDAERMSQQGIDAEMTGIPIEATAETKEIAGQDPRAPDYTLAEAKANLDAAKAEAYADKQFGFDTGLPSSINVFGANIPTGIGVVEGIADALFDPESSLANAIAERGIKSVDGMSAEGTANYNPNGLEVVTTGTPVTEGGRTAAYDPSNNVVYDTDPFSGVNPFGEERVPENIQNLYSKKNAIDDVERARQGDGGAQVTQTTAPEPPPVVPEYVPRIYGGPANVNFALPPLTQYTQMAAPRPTALQPSQLIAPRPVDPLTGRPFAAGGIVNAFNFGR